MSRQLYNSTLGVSILAAPFALLGCQPARQPTSDTSQVEHERLATSRVVSPRGTIAGAVIQAPGGPVLATSDEQGRFQVPAEAPDVLSIFKPGHFIKRVERDSLSGTIELKPLPSEDATAYAWVDPMPDPDRTASCGNCHSEVYQQWRGGAHAGAAVNRQFLNLYDGSDAHGRADVGWNLLRDHPEGAGVCQSCHAPSTSAENLSDDIRSIRAIEKLGVHCDFCHKVIDVVDDQQFGLAHGQYAVRLLRPEQGQLVFGPRSDATGFDNAHAPVQSESRFCATCHEGTVFGVHVYSTWSEWRDSPAGHQGVSCQSCHMKPNYQMTNTAPGHGGPERQAEDVASHDLLPGGLEAMLESCLQVDVKTKEQIDAWQIIVTVRASDVGHAVPTGFIDRHLLLAVRALDEKGNEIEPQDGPLLSHVAGEPLAGKGGLLFAKLLTGIDGKTPSPFWKPIASVNDTRLRPQTPQIGTWKFPKKTKSVEVKLIYRRFWREVAKAKRWEDDDVLVFQRELRLQKCYEPIGIVRRLRTSEN
jgi:hypothetical protein